MRAIVMAMMVWLASFVAVQAHEVQPAVADLTVENGAARLAVTLNIEPIVAGVNLQGVADTNETDGAGEVDRLRGLTPQALEPEVRATLPSMIEGINLRTGQAPVPIEIAEIDIGPVGNVELARETRLVFTGPVPSSANEIFMDWPAAYGTLILRQQGVEDPYTGYLTDGEGSGPIQLRGGDAQTGWAAFWRYIPVGFDHIVPKGLDHILFVLALFFLSTRPGPLLWQVTAFTAAHTVTLALGALGLVKVPASIVEPLIAASIAFVAVENMLSDRLSRWRPFVIFGFGLLHGLGFASVLGEFGLPQEGFVPALIGFNIGVEIGQLAVIAAAFGIVALAIRVDRGDADVRTGQIVYALLAASFVALAFGLRGGDFAEVAGASSLVFFLPLAALCLLCFTAATKIDHLRAYRKFVAIPASGAIGIVGAYWFVERVFL